MSMIKTLLKSNKAINAFDSKVGGFLGGVSGTLDRMLPKRMVGPLAAGEKRGVSEGMGFFDAVNEAHKAAPGQMAIGGYSAKKIAGSYLGVSAAARVASGGGVYKDNNGNTDLIGIPFI